MYAALFKSLFACFLPSRRAQANSFAINSFGLPSGSIRAMADLDAGCITEAGLERLDTMRERCLNLIFAILRNA